MTENPSGAYYADRLNADRLRRCYELAPPRVQQYLRAEIEFVLRHIRSGDRILELGCGYGRALEAMIGRASELVGIDNSVGSLAMAVNRSDCCRLAAMDAGHLGFLDGIFDVTFCIQNGICAFGIERPRLFVEATRVTKPGGTALFSSYAERFWPERLEWFRIQAGHGLLGEIDEKATGDGVIVCKDGFRTETARPDELEQLAARAGYTAEVVEVDESSVFCVISVS